MCHIQAVWDDSSDFKMSFAERVSRSLRIRYRLLILGVLRFREKLRKQLSLSSESNNSNTDVASERSYTPLKPGDMVRVRSFDEIQCTLDKNGNYKGMLFINEMVRYCGKTYRVFKRVNKVYVHRHGKMSKCHGVVLLDGVFCDGYGPDIDCDRTCFFFWKEAWLEKIK